MSLLRKINIRTRIMLFLILGIILFSGIVLYVSKSISQGMIGRHLLKYLEDTQQEVAKSIELLIDEVNMLSARLMTKGKFTMCFTMTV